MSSAGLEKWLVDLKLWIWDVNIPNWNLSSPVTEATGWSMLLDSRTQTLEVSFRLMRGEGSYVVYARLGQMKCFECGDVAHKCFSHLDKQLGPLMWLPLLRASRPLLARPLLSVSSEKRPTRWTWSQWDGQSLWSCWWTCWGRRGGS